MDNGGIVQKNGFLCRFLVLYVFEMVPWETSCTIFV